MDGVVADRCDSYLDLQERLESDAASIQPWINALVVVRFDLNVGPVIECIYPTGSDADQLGQKLCTMALPDSTNDYVGDCIFIVRIPCADLFGIICFRQLPDATIERGFFQKSLVILTKLPLMELWENIIGILAPIYFDHGHLSVMEASAHNLSEWPDPFQQSSDIQLHFLGQVFSVSIPRSIVVEGGCLYGTFLHTKLYDVFEQFLPDLFKLWELATIGAPVLIIAGDPSLSTNAVLGLVSILQLSLVYRGDYRPYFTMSDPDYIFYLTMCNHNRLPGCILGTTSKYFAESFEKFPNVLRLDSGSGLITARPCHCKVDTKFRQSISNCQDKNEAVRSHFEELTAAILTPFEMMLKPLPYVHRDTTEMRTFNPYLDQPKLPDFSIEKFIQWLGASSQHIAHVRPFFKSRKHTLSFYKAFMKGANFMPWFESRRTEALKDLDSRTDAAIIAVGISRLTLGLSGLIASLSGRCGRHYEPATDD